MKILPPKPLAAFNEHNPFLQQVSRRLALAEYEKSFTISMGPLIGKAGTIVTIQSQPRLYFRSGQIIITGNPGARIKQFFVGNRLQTIRPGTLINKTGTYAVLDSGPDGFDICDPAIFLTMHVEFAQDCTFAASIMGSIVRY